MRTTRSRLLILGAATAVAIGAGCSKNAAPPAQAAASTPVSQPAPSAASPQLHAAMFVAADLPLLPPGVVNAVAPLQVTKAAYEFAARHPEVLKHIPCFCGCERGGHKGNHDCFVAGRDAETGRVTAWDNHGISCEVCIDVAYQSMQMHNAGASAADIRAAVDKRYASASHRTPTPHPPHGGDHE